MDALGIFELGAKAGRAYVCAIRQAYRDAKAGEVQSDYYASRLGRAEEGGEALEPQCDGCGHNVCICPELNDWPDGPQTADELALADRYFEDVLQPADKPTCYFCGDPTINIVITDSADHEFVCEQCADDELTAPAAPQVPSSSAGRGVGSPGVSAGAEEPAPPGWRHAEVIRDVLSDHAFWVANASSIGSNGHCLCGERPHGAMAWREHVAPLIAEAVGVGATPTPKPAEAAEMYPQYQKRTEK